MFRTPIKTALAATLFLSAPSGPVAADNLGAALLGGIVGGAIVNEVNRNKKRRTVSQGYSATRAHNRETQASLNYFGFPAGTPDGVMGRRSRTAISQYQVHMGFPATGQLTAYERDFLVSSYNRAQIGGPQVIKAMQGPNGVRGLLHTWRDEAAGVRSASTGYAGLPIEVSDAVDEIAASAEPSAEQLLQRSGFMQLADINGDGKNDYLIDTSVSGSSFWCGASHCSVMVFASTPQGYQRNDFMARGVTTASFSCHQGVCRMNDTMQASGQGAGQAVPAAPAPATPPAASQQGGTVMASAGGQALGAIPTFNAPSQAAQTASLASHCSKVSLLTNSNGGYMTVSTMTDPDLALGEQFCIARSYAMNSGEAIVATLTNVTSAQVDSQCDSFAPAIQPFLARLSSDNSQAVMADVQKFVLQSNMSIDQLANTAAVCMFSGYRRDKLDIAMGSALIMVAIGKRPYAELIGHHMSQGFGAAKSVPAAQDWYGVAVSALENGAEAVFSPGQPERAGLIKAAAAQLGGSGQLQPVPASGAAAALPTFSNN
ncbi:peptidoglycan-binding domain-containing protein [Phaeobacter gallaeciensis]|uniref:peptidoglycan-binding domain-containing protein n=1 Tax=Phaeobacter gallaeciensis TaxID=60890 RepID=UPI00237F1E97|nr:peptidoglycan-binding domain-containing protein [Phaeobacter gallaeciensis]MDE4097308.1 peptidoglycan-binding domain-containing protein [Phaeobacter gallaeciensis]MDE4106178.1 peptidoglycan-binding domain-containing protein [Phaeobacter gallaeciensis]MDE4110572.1 peptidoglycan-binding domain-containing protein [Phaeobacter gallaeciensis]MDE4115043.1 peptidoglycan-binding domain-containing protein [Phaeobacter gallaeciensis]MDE4119512.1 peptidoglycan-binding domain-containing protein [Phaeob